MKYELFINLPRYTIVTLLTIYSVFSFVFINLNYSSKTSQASFKCPDGYSYFAGNGGDKSKPLPHNCTKSDDMVMSCENDYVEHPTNICQRDLVVYRCPKPLNSNDFIIHKSILDPQVSKLNLNIWEQLANLTKPINASALFGPDPTTFLPDEYKNYGDLCTFVKYKNNFSVNNICNNKIFGENPNSQTKPLNLTSNGIPLPDENGLVSYFNDLALKFDSKDYGKLKTDLYDLFNNDSSLYSNQLCLAPTKALRANVSSSVNTPSCFLGIGCGPTKYTINEVVADVADTCNLQTRTCLSKVRCIRTIHKCEPQNLTVPIEEFTYYIGKEQKSDNGEELSNGRAVQFEPDYENLPQDRIYLPNTSTTTICPNSTEWRPFFVAAKTDFQSYDTSLMKDKAIVTPYTCVKKGFNLKAAYTLLRDASQDCGGRQRIYADAASGDDSAMIICTPPLKSSIKVPVCPGGTSINVIGNYTNIEGSKCFKSIEPELYVVDSEVIGEPICTPKNIKPNTKLNCVFNVSKSNFAGYQNNLDLAKIASNPNFVAPIDSKFESCKSTGLGLTESEIYLNKLTCAALSTSLNSKRYPGHFVLPEGGIKVKIQNLDATNLATSDNCKIPSSTTDGKTTYENLLVCENLSVGENFVEGAKNVVVQVGDFNNNKGTIDARLGGCAEGVADIYDCYKCLSGQAYTPGKPCFQPGESVATKDSPLSGIKNQPAPIIPIKDETLPTGTPAKLTPEGCTTIIAGTIITGGFVPNTGEKIGDCAKPGPTTAALEVDGKKIEIPTNFSNKDIGVATNVVVETKIGSPAPTIDLPNNALPSGTPATFTPNGASIAIKGTIQDNKFVPVPGQTIPMGSTPGLAIGVLKTADTTTGIKVNIQSSPELIKNVPFVRTGGAAWVKQD
jgi:hypothetical protein